METFDAVETFDVLIVGAGLAGIDAAYRLREKNPDLNYVILENRARIGGTWDLFTYPGIRSDSDIFTLSFPWNPWKGNRLIAEGHEIRQYLEDTAHDFGIAPHIRFGSEVVAADFDTGTGLWTVDVRVDGEPATYRARFFYSCTGYYRYDAGYLPDFPGIDDFTGTVVHPQFWPADLDYTGKKVVVIGSGATAITLIPSMAATAGHVTMLQRSPTYLFPYPWTDPITAGLQKVLPRQLSHDITRYRNMLLTLVLYLFCRGFPKAARRLLRWIAVRQLPDGYPVDTHFKPAYQPWDQRLCIIPDADFYKAVADGSAEVVTDTVDTFTPTGIALASGRELDADIIVTATGLELLAFGGIDLSVDGEPVEPGDKYAYRGYMLNEVPNFAWSVGYTNASWTLRVDLTSKAVADLIQHMRAHGYTRAYPTLDGATPPAHGLLELDSGYVRRAGSRLPKAADTAPWLVRHNAILDAVDARRYDVTEAMVFS
ncbi:NAD(P)-binding protein [Gordonia pseudamarae]|uniref:NAD(P)-binding protein n=1 Tax=Gordonia pseudamarae TaxID=2831662 RepID=A0ABX6IRX8_9ACTN|nr:MULTISPECIES: NAD(P)/FAD-dependent oxidoreductase [Gordonia]MBD0022167.1 NAD(P)/FAD-dependent oxidoreductase [Gordonia sp. (in: high G+C Gram-positive bacteria)]QHN28875.1 NAD(P)-binding protein [Gordonia pseudamarae]QHN37746.1 NAD(P)-binding protein [Gordonia pseudamarae]